MTAASTESSVVDLDDGVCLEHAEALVTALQRNDATEVARLLDELTALRETQIYQRIGRLTRELHDAFIGFCDDARICAIARDEMPNARERLRHVITLTQESAETTLTAVEQCLPLAQTIGERAQSLAERWISFRERRLSLDEFRELSGELEAFLTSMRKDADDLHTGLSDVLVAQEFQDLTGQMIQRVIALVDEVQEKLVAIIELAQPGATDRRAEGGSGLGGPVVPALKTADTVNGQDEVDELLSSLGF